MDDHPICEDCEERLATKFCVECDQRQCDACEEEIHRKSRRAKHSRSAIIKKPQNKEPPSKSCGFPETKSIDISAPSVVRTLCEECDSDGCTKESPRLASVYCVDCEMKQCDKCDARVHSSGARKRHHRKRINSLSSLAKSQTASVTNLGPLPSMPDKLSIGDKSSSSESDEDDVTPLPTIISVEEFPDLPHGSKSQKNVS